MMNKTAVWICIYLLILAHCIILMIEGHYTYAQVPFLTAWENCSTGSAINFAQGFVPAVVAREILIRKQAADSFPGTRGYIWDTLSDMAWALFGSAAALVLLARLHDRQLTLPAKSTKPDQEAGAVG